MPIGPTTYFGKERVFVDREACIQAFRENIQNSEIKEYNVLFYYGIAGIGKSKLQEELQKILKEEYPEIFWASIDLDVKTYRDIGTFLITLRNKIQEEHSAKFHLFNAVHAIYWKKLHPEIPLQKQNYPLIEKGDILDKIIGVLENSSKLSLAWELLNSASDSFRKWCHLHHIDVSKIESLEPNKIEELLPGIFAADFFEHFGENSKFYIFIDTYEALWDGLRDKGSFHEKDKWIRDNLIPNMLGVSWVICGREKLLWFPECDSDWDMYLEQHSVDELPESYCTKFLEDCGIENKDIRDLIIKASEGVPYYLNLSVDTFEKINKKRQPVSKYFGKTQPEIFNIFVKYLDHNEIRALEVLSAPNFWDRDLFEILMKKFDPGYPTGAFSKLIKFSFIKTDSNEKYSIHQLMRKSLQEHQDSTDRKSTHQFLLAYYSDKIEELDIKAITPEHEIALTEAFYHAKESLEAEKLCEWFISVSDSFNRAAFWQLITPMYEEMLQILKTKLGNEHPDVATTLNNLAGLYYHMGAYDKALPLYQRALEIYKEVPESEHPDVANSLNNLAELYRRMGAYDKALPLYQRALGIRENILGSQHLDVANSLNNFAVLYESMGEYDKALPLYQRALGIRENVLGFQHPSVATTLDNLAVLYYRMGAYDKALPLYQRALEIYEKVLGSDHPDVATTLNNLAELYHHTGAYEKSLPLFQRALEIVEKTLGPEHPDVATILNNLAGLHESMGEYNKALPLYQRALDTREKVLDPQHPSVATTLNNLAGLYRQMGEYEKALPLSQRALEIIEKKLEPKHPNTVTIKNNYNFLLSEMSEGDEEK
ncbi:hypothetical protein MSBRW_3360 [Methanosarcina barkeri str. Wiesmoor]|uniref:Uncharacterized protein n=2 Tax=Methanosarcina barkeri TaxID=2208 RepID=A0A0E3QPZ0_METBA|nr:tetratricopeptide repeat protein [Methanosarcina barkeri]AKB52613.1 hypothetical protein MSBRW_3360 [Methanosarcina barkeri str. Wiesmoor]